jgi:succinyl-diaminopimelate desuccinylase
MTIDPIELSQRLIRCPSVTPEDAGALDLLQEVLENLGFVCERMVFSSEGTADVDNLYARLGITGKNLCFAGHTDVVPVGDAAAWSVDPFAAEIVKQEEYRAHGTGHSDSPASPPDLPCEKGVIKESEQVGEQSLVERSELGSSEKLGNFSGSENKILIGRGVVDMKCAIAAWVAAVSQAGEVNGSISLLITGDEEGPAINGTRKMLKALADKGEKIDACVVGEPTNPKQLGEMIKIGRRGSENFKLTLFGTQGHSAYPQLADNPMPRMVEILSKLQAEILDEGTEHFDPSNLEITTIDTGNMATNILPAQVSAGFNIRFNDNHTCKSLADWVRSICDSVTDKYELEVEETGEAFITEPGEFSSIVANAVKSVTGLTPELSTTGGTSDARFIKDHAQVVEFGLTNETAHKVNECAYVEDIEKLSQIYLKVIEGYF